MINTPDAVKSFYEYLKSIPEMDKFHKLPIPTTEYQNNLKELSITPIELWVRSLVVNNTEDFTMTGEQAYNSFSMWKNVYNSEYNTSSLIFGVRLSNLKIDGLSKSDRNKKAVVRQFDYNKLKKYFHMEDDEEQEEIEYIEE